MIADIYQRHTADFKRYNISFDHYSSTNSPENQQLANEIYGKAVTAGVIHQKEISQSFCPKDGMFLPDRMIRGTCPHCGSRDQYGDSCEKCSATYDPSDLKDSHCSLCGTAPILKSSTHFFFRLESFKTEIATWIKGGHVQQEVANKLEEWFETGLRDWDISRDAPYFGFKIPGTEDKFFYVWLDAPIGYIATTQQWAAQTGANWETYWKNPSTEIFHFIGKDILYFHTLFWPALLMTGEFSLPTKVHVHGFLTINGEKMSKSLGTFINASEFADQFNPEYLRYYFASKLSNGIDDIDLNFEDFVFKVNAEVVNKIVNIASRLGSIVTKSCGGTLSTPDAAGEVLLTEIEGAADLIASLYEKVDFQKATREIMALADKANQYIDSQAPWSVAKTDPDQARQIATSGLNALRVLAIYLKPIIPAIVAGVEAFLNLPALEWAHIPHRMDTHSIHPYQHLAQRMDMATVKQFIDSRNAQ
jgi:methionyl-tRNA synthetase